MATPPATETATRRRPFRVAGVMRLAIVVDGATVVAGGVLTVVAGGVLSVVSGGVLTAASGGMVAYDEARVVVTLGEPLASGFGRVVDGADTVVVVGGGVGFRCKISSIAVAA